MRNNFDYKNTNSMVDIVNPVSDLSIERKPLSAMVKTATIVAKIMRA